MSDETKTRVGGWSDAEKFSFLVKVIAQIGGDKTSIKFDQIDMPGRTPKAMSHVWSKIRADVATMDNGEVKPTPTTPRKRDAKGGDDEDEANGESPTKKQKTPAPRKKAAPKAKAAPKKATAKGAKSTKKVESDDAEVVPEQANESNDDSKVGTKVSSKVIAEGADTMEADEA